MTQNVRRITLRRRHVSPGSHSDRLSVVSSLLKWVGKSFRRCFKERREYNRKKGWKKSAFEGHSGALDTAVRRDKGGLDHGTHLLL